MSLAPKPAPDAPKPAARLQLDAAERGKVTRFSAPSLIGGTGRQPAEGDTVTVTDSASNNGVWTVAEADEDWIRVVIVNKDGTPGRGIVDEAPSRAAKVAITEAR